MALAIPFGQGKSSESSSSSSHATPVFLSFKIDKDYGVFDFSFPKPSSATQASPASFSSSASASASCRASTICRKRARPLADIDGESREITKKRRLRLTFVTSRLSAPFASPPRNNVDRGNSKIAIWAKQRAIPPHQFRKMAILNRIKREAMALREAQQRQIEIARQQQLEKMMATPPRRTSKRLQSKKAPKQVMVENTVEQNQSRVSSRPMREYRKIAPDPNHTPMHRRPPTPPSEEELENQRKQRKRK